jgi:hypothetical protein
VGFILSTEDFQIKVRIADPNDKVKTEFNARVTFLGDAAATPKIPPMSRPFRQRLCAGPVARMPRRDLEHLSRRRLDLLFF